MRSDTGMEFENLTQHIYVALDIFHAFMQNKPIETPLEAWLMLLTTRDLSRIEELTRKYPDFADIYQEIFELRTRPEELIYMFSKVLLEGDRNMERFMIDEFKKEKEQAKLEAELAKAEARQAKDEARKAMDVFQQIQEENEDLKAIIADLQAKLAAAENPK